jgi:hypothetical protein
MPTEGVRGQGLIGTYNVPTAERIEDYDMAVFQVLPGDRKNGTLFAMFQGGKFGKRNVDKSKFTWWDEPMPRSTSTLAGGILAGAANLTVAAGHGKYFQKEDLIFNESKNEFARKTDTGVGDTMDIAKAEVGSDSAWSDGDKLVNLGRIPLEGGGVGKMLTESPTERSNFITYKDSFVEMTRRMKKEGPQKTGLEYPRRKKNALIDIYQKVEMDLLFGKKGQIPDNTAGGYRYTQDGFISQIPVNRKFTDIGKYGADGTVSAMAATNWKNLMTLAEDVFLYGSAQKIAFVEPGAHTTLLRMLATENTLNQEVVNASDLYGKAVAGWGLRMLRLGGYTLTLIPMPLWKEKDVFQDHMLIVDPMHVKLASLGSSAVTFVSDIQQDGATRETDRFEAWYGLQLENPQAHAIVKIPTIA